MSDDHVPDHVSTSQARIIELNRDVDRANALLPDELQIWNVPESTGAQEDLRKVLDVVVGSRSW